MNEWLGKTFHQKTLPTDATSPPPKLLAAVDLGSNSFRLHLGYHDGQRMQVLHSAREPNRLAAGLDPAGKLTPAAMEKGLDALVRLGDVLRHYEPDEVRIVGTNTLRIASNAPKFMSLAENKVGYPIDVISGEEEARLIYLGIAHQLAIPNENRLIIDIGGGSTEVILGKGPHITRAESISIGTVWQSQHFFPNGVMHQAAFDSAILFARSRFEKVFPHRGERQWVNVYGSSGTLRAIGEILDRNHFGNGDITRENLTALMHHMTECGNLKRLKLNKLSPDRAPSIVGGLPIIMGIMKEFEIERIFPIEGGLRLGVMWDLHLRSHDEDRREQSVKECMKRFGCDADTAENVSQHALALFQQLKPSTPDYADLLRWSCALHEMGLFVSPTNYHKHGAYLVEHADLPGFTSREQKLMGRFIIAQKGNLRKIATSLDIPDVIKAILALRLAVLLAQAKIEHGQAAFKVKLKERIEIELAPEVLAQHPTLAYLIEREKSFWEDVGLAFSLKA